jgi:hypothetical protein
MVVISVMARLGRVLQVGEPSVPEPGPCEARVGVSVSEVKPG